jgi:hypothetical protein
VIDKASRTKFPLDADPPSEKLLLLSVVAHWVYRLAAAGETFRKPPEKLSNPN